MNAAFQVSSEEEGQVKQPPLMMAALRVGGAPRIDPDQAIVEAVELAKSKDAVIVVIGAYSFFLFRISRILSSSLYTGLNMDWEAEGMRFLWLPGAPF